MNFWNVIWYFFLSFAFIAYLFALFAVIVDIFRDHALNGWLKAVWLLFLVFVPFLTVLVYVIARGESMTRRSVRDQHAAQSATDDYIRNVAGSSSPSDQIQKAKGLLDSGVITSAEYETLKADALRVAPAA